MPVLSHLTPRRLLGLAVVLITATASLSATVSPPASAAASDSVTPAAYAANCGSTATGVMACQALHRTGFAARPMTANGVPYGYGPADLVSAYQLPTGAAAGSGRRVFVVDAYDDPTAESDLASYRAEYGLPACTTADGCFVKLNQSGASAPLPSANAGWAGEISLDLDMVSAVCPNCGITLIEADTAGADLFTSVQEAVTLGAKYVSMSWGGQESGYESYFDQYFQAPGVVFAAATGDGGFGQGVIYPSTSPDVLAVGGTSLQRSATARGWTESAWGSTAGGADGAGSGCSSDEPQPSWQAGVVPASACSTRAVADVSAVADPSTGVAVYQTYGGNGSTNWSVYGGTSAATPIIASVAALAGTPGATDHPDSYPYADPAGLNDVTSGATGTCAQAVLCAAATGWDGPTGLGTPDGVAAFAAPTTAAPTTAAPTTAAPTTAAPTTPAPTTAAPTTPAPTTPAPTTPAPTTSPRPPAPPTCGGQLLANPGFERRTLGWHVTSGVVLGRPRWAHSGSWLAHLDGYGRAHVDTASQTVVVPARCRAVLSYYLWVTSSDRGRAAHDTFGVSVNGRTLVALSNLNRGAGYVHRVLDLSRYAGQRITLTFTGRENSSLATAFMVDDVTVTVSR